MRPRCHTPSRADRPPACRTACAMSPPTMIASGLSRFTAAASTSPRMPAALAQACAAPRDRHPTGEVDNIADVPDRTPCCCSDADQGPPGRDRLDTAGVAASAAHACRGRGLHCAQFPGRPGRAALQFAARDDPGAQPGRGLHQQPVPDSPRDDRRALGQRHDVHVVVHQHRRIGQLPRSRAGQGAPAQPLITRGVQAAAALGIGGPGRDKPTPRIGGPGVPDLGEQHFEPLREVRIRSSGPIPISWSTLVIARGFSPSSRRTASCVRLVPIAPTSTTPRPASDTRTHRRFARRVDGPSLVRSTRPTGRRSDTRAATACATVRVTLPTSARSPRCRHESTRRREPRFTTAVKCMTCAYRH